MSVVDESLVAEIPVGESVFGDAFLWCRADDSRWFDPLTDIAFGDVGPINGGWIAAMVEHSAQSLSLLERIDPSGFDTATTTAWAKGVEQLRRQAAAAAIAVADHLDTAKPFEDLGFSSAKNWMKHPRSVSLRPG